MKSIISYTKLSLVALLFAGLLLTSACGKSTSSTSTPQATEANANEWSKDATIYEVNTRQYTSEGTFQAFRAHLPRLEKLGVKVLWFMPISPIGVDARKGTLGSYYSISDYCDTNPEFGTVEDFKQVVNDAHARGMKVLIDWVPNHTSRDHAWVTDHPDWYVNGKDGKPIGPYDWSDVAQLNYGNKDMQEAMVESMKFWLTECNIDGFRCDVAGLARDYVTEQQAIDFWEYVAAECNAVKPVFMLAEDEGVRALTLKAFDANYAWEFHHIMNQVAQSKQNVSDLQKYFEKDVLNFAKKVYRMTFTSNHDENSWNGTEFMRMGDAAKAMAVLTFTAPGFPLIYTGQEVGNKRCLEFFEKDVVEWSDGEGFTPFYQSLIGLKKGYSALHNGLYGADMFWVKNSDNKKVLSFVREDEASKVFCVFNMSSEVVKNVEYEGDAYRGAYVEYFSGLKVDFDTTPNNILNPWEYRVYVMRK